MNPTPTPAATRAMIDCAGKASIAILRLNPASGTAAAPCRRAAGRSAEGRSPPARVPGRRVDSDCGARQVDGRPAGHVEWRCTDLLDRQVRVVQRRVNQTHVEVALTQCAFLLRPWSSRARRARRWATARGTARRSRDTRRKGRVPSPRACSCPISPRSVRSASAAASSICRSILRASARNAVARRGSATPSGCCGGQGAHPSACSSRRICWLIAGWLMWQRSAARPKCSSSASATKHSSPVRSTPPVNQ